MIFDDILHGAEGRFADTWRRMGVELEANHGELDRIAAEQKRAAEDLRAYVREMREAVDKRSRELDDSIAAGERSFEAHMLDVETALSSLRAERARSLGKEPSTAGNDADKRNGEMKRKGEEHVG